MKKIHFIFLLFYFSTLTVNGQLQSSWMSMNIDNEAGLSNSAVTSIYMDSEGMMWFGSWDGLNMYNGTDIEVFKPDVFRKGAISNNIIREFVEDNNHSLWVVTDMGINKLNKDNMQFRAYLSDINNLPVKEHNLKACLLPDSSVFVSLYGYGQACYDALSDKFIPVKLPGLPDTDAHKIVGLYCCPDGKLYLFSANGNLYTYHCGDGFKKIISYELKQLENLYLERNWFVEVDNAIYLAVALRTGGIQLNNLQTSKSCTLLENQSFINVTTINESWNSDFLWVGTDAGTIFKINFDPQPKVERQNRFFPELLAKHIKIWTIKQTTDDLLWIGTDGGGVYRYITKGKPFYNIKKGEGRLGVISHNIVRAITKDKKGNLWVGTRGDGLNMMPHNGKDTRYYNTSNGLSNNAVIALGMDEKDNLWIGVDGEGIDMLEKTTGRILHFPEDFENSVDLDFGSVYAICVDVYGSVWLGTGGYGLLRLDVDKKSNGKYYLTDYKHYRYDSGVSSLKSDIVYSIVEERPNVLWVGTRRGGLHRLNTLNGVFTVYGKVKETSAGLSNDDVLSLYIGHDEKLWIGTSGGLNMLDLSYKPYQFKHFTEYDGLPNNTVHGIMEDEQNNIWITTNRGLSKLMINENRFVNFNKTDGLQNNEYTDGAVYNDTVNDLLYLGGVEGIDWFNPRQIKHADHFPPIVLDEFRLYNDVIFPGDSSHILNTVIGHTDELKLNYDQNFFSFSFSTLNYYNSQKCEFVYRLDGFDQDWNFIETQRTANFTNVPPGNYLFEVMATNEDGVMGSEVKQIRVVINPPLWKTAYAYVAYVLLSVIILSVIIVLTKKRIKEKREHEIEKINRQKKDEINRYKLQFFTNIAHEFRTPLTLILAPAVTLMKYLDEDKKLGVYARSIFQNANRLQCLIQELIEFRKVETGNMKLEIRQHELISYFGELIRHFDFFAKQNEIDLTFVHEEPEIVAWVDIKKLEKVLLNLISNAIKYTPKGGAVEVNIEQTDGELCLVVKDNGIGISEDMIEKVFDRFFHDTGALPRGNNAQEGTGVGLSLTKSLVELHKGKISVNSYLDCGSVFKVILPTDKKLYKDYIVEDEFVVQSDRIAKKVFDEIRISEEYQKDVQLDEEGNENRERKKYTILVVDDNIEVCRLIDDLLNGQYNMLTAHNGLEALDAINNKNVDIVISDVIMPEMNGLELCDKIKSDINTCHIPVILLTAKGELSQRIEGIEAGADSYIPKPFHPAHLMVRIRKLLETKERFRTAYREYDDKAQTELMDNLSSKDKDLLSDLTCYIEENMEDSLLNAEHLADHFAMSKTQLYRKIKALTDYTPHGLIKYVRLKEAAALLKSGDKTVSEVFYETGFNNRTYFYRSFKKAFGVTPGEYSKHLSAE